MGQRAATPRCWIAGTFVVAGDDRSCRASGYPRRMPGVFALPARRNAGTLRPSADALRRREERSTRDAGRRGRLGALDTRSWLCGDLLRESVRLRGQAGLTAADVAMRRRGRDRRNGDRLDDARRRGDGRTLRRWSHTVGCADHHRPTRPAEQRKQRIERRASQAPHCDQCGGCPDQAQKGREAASGDHADACKLTGAVRNASPAGAHRRLVRPHRTR